MERQSIEIEPKERKPKKTCFYSHMILMCFSGEFTNPMIKNCNLPIQWSKIALMVFEDLFLFFFFKPNICSLYWSFTRGIWSSNPQFLFKCDFGRFGGSIRYNFTSQKVFKCPKLLFRFATKKISICICKSRKKSWLKFTSRHDLLGSLRWTNFQSI